MRNVQRTIGIAVVCLALVLGGQAAADSLVPDASGAETNEAVGRAASSYLTGIKTYAAAALWNRIDPVMHGYYAGIPIGEQRYMLSTISLVIALDPHQEQAYSVGSWILADNGRVEDAMSMAEKGVEANPNAGLLLSNLAQMEYLYGEGLDAAVTIAERALADDVEWIDGIQQHQWYPLLGDIFRQAGRDDLDALVQERLERLDGELGDELSHEDHDHDHDGVPDH
jgi:tetratricopeptide (TPR) repeat protein